MGFFNGVVSERDIALTVDALNLLASFEDRAITQVSVKPGDHLVAKRLFGLYSHHGFYIGEGKVIHYTPDKARSAKGSIQLTMLADFLQQSRLYKRHYTELREGVDVPTIADLLRRSHQYNRHYKLREGVDVQSAIERARSCLGETSYNVLFNNCEHFAEWCSTGDHRSSQAERLLLALISATKR